VILRQLFCEGGCRTGQGGGATPPTPQCTEKSGEPEKPSDYWWKVISVPPVANPRFMDSGQRNEAPKVRNPAMSRG
jgi:hypothetical protein